jgi:hypothetical protein
MFTLIAECGRVAAHREAASKLAALVALASQARAIRQKTSATNESISRPNDSTSHDRAYAGCQA